MFHINTFKKHILAMEKYELLNQRVVSLTYEVTRLSKEVSAILNSIQLSPTQTQDAQKSILKMTIYRPDKKGINKFKDTKKIPIY